MIKRLDVFQALSPSYLFPEINRRKELFLKEHSEVKLTNLGIGDTVLPLPQAVADALSKASAELGTPQGYSGYGKDQGDSELRQKIRETYYPHLSIDEIFISDGAKSEIGRLQTLFGGEIVVGLQDPAYPVYLDGSILQGAKKIHFLPCHPGNNFFPELLPELDLLYICNPNNPTGVVYTYDELKKLVDYALKNEVVILYDGAYAGYIQDEALPKTIYEIPGADKVAIEVNSFSKLAGFTGIRLGWTVIPKALTFDCGHPIWEDYYRFASTIFNGASNIAQKGGVAVFSEEGWKGIQENIAYTMENAKWLKKRFLADGYQVYGGENAPYIWVHTPQRYSWDVFQEFLEKKHLIVTPGKGYGPTGEHFFRVSAFARREAILHII
ncbi:MAG: LL-diaminopimelate aminotransferase [Simkaniaceae bacterium]|nr:MAG: LL-diaminopimelate aminotransferase [Simkaniaceae bacterium]